MCDSFADGQVSETEIRTLFSQEHAGGLYSDTCTQEQKKIIGQLDTYPHHPSPSWLGKLRSGKTSQLQ